MENQETLKEWNENPKYWKWGLFYFNKEDKRLFVSKKTEWMGMTLNFANPKWIFYIIGFICFYSIVFFFVYNHICLFDLIQKFQWFLFYHISENKYV